MARTPQTDEDPIRLLRRLHKQNRSTLLERVQVEVGGKPTNLYVVGEGTPGQEAVWVSPNIRVEWLEGASQELRDQVERHMMGRGSPQLLADLLAGARKQGVAVVDWDKASGLNGPREVEKAQVVRELGANPLAREASA